MHLAYHHLDSEIHVCTVTFSAPPLYTKEIEKKRLGRGRRQVATCLGMRQDIVLKHDFAQSEIPRFSAVGQNIIIQCIK